MEMKKVSIVGAGNVGATVAHSLALKNIVKEIVLVDIKQGVSEGKSLDIWESGPIQNYATKITGVTNDYSVTSGSDICVITAGFPRKPGMSRDDLIQANYKIVAEAVENLLSYSPNPVLVIVTNPLDVMTYCAWDVSGLPAHRGMGMSGVLDVARFRTFIADALGVSPRDVQAMILGGHGDTMVPLPRYSSVSGIPITELLEPEVLNKISERARYGGGEIVNLLGTSAWYAPGAAVSEMLECIILDHKRILPVCAYLNGEYGVSGLFIGVPALLSSKGVEKVIELKLNDEERNAFMKSVSAVKELVEVYKKLKAKAT